MSLRYFGTDGIRGKAFDSPLTTSEVARWGKSWSQAALNHKVQTLVLGHDPRLSSEPLLKAFISVMDPSISLIYLGMVPTPVLAYETSRMSGAWGVMFSASHNPPLDNGIKGFSSSGEKLEEAVEMEIETIFDSTPVADKIVNPNLPAIQPHQYLNVHEPFPVPVPWRIAIDCAHGAASTLAQNIFLGQNIHWMGTPSDGARINHFVGCTHLETLQKVILESNLDFGFAFDGDADRCLFVDSKGDVFDGDQILWLLVKEGIRAGRPPEGVVGTVMTNGALEHLILDAGIPFLRTPVGDKFILRAMATCNYPIGAEASGHVIQKSLGPTGDGLATALSVCRILKDVGIREVFESRFKPFPHQLVSFTTRLKKPIDMCPSLNGVLDNLSKEFPSLRTVIRWSGTENKLRLMAEAPDLHSVNIALERLQHAALRDLN